MKTAADYHNASMRRARDHQEAGLLEAKGAALMRVLNARDMNEKQAAEADLARASEQLRKHGFAP